ncbi:MAG: hypothetical protein KDA50_12485 [Rhodobacteraceae bacterium]|nr:hypothetical protein [Paracoccaceae bacterium]
MGPRRALMAGAICGVLVFVNCLPARRWGRAFARPFLGRVLNAGFLVLIGIELFLPRPYLIWLRGGGERRGGDGFLSRVVLVAMHGAAVLALFVPFAVVMPWAERHLRSGQAEIVFGSHYARWSRFDVSDLAWDPLRRHLLLCGDQQDTVVELNVDTRALRDTGLENHGNEFCEFDRKRDLFLTADASSGELIAAKGADMADLKRVRLNDLPPGEIFVSLFDAAGLVVAASENENGRGTGPEIRVIDLDRMEVVREIDSDVGFSLAHPDLPILYVNHFAKDFGIRAIDIEQGQVIARSPFFGRSDRMVFDAARNEVLATAPVDGRIYRFDATTLEPRGYYRTVFGARGLALDPVRNLLLVSSFVTNKLDIIDMGTGKSLRRYWLGPWLRDVRLTDEPGAAYVGSRYALYRVRYLE